MKTESIVDLKPLAPINYGDNIARWNAKRFDESYLISQLTLQGNKFSVTRTDMLIEPLHVYFALDPTGRINIYVMPESADVIGNFNWMDESYLSRTKEYLPPNILPDGEQVNPYVSYETASKWVNNWIDDNKRGAWIQNNFNVIPNQNTILIAFTINSGDFAQGIAHDCYLALKQQSNKWVIDLIVCNSQTGVIVNFNKENTSMPFEAIHVSDLARPVPPFGQGGNAYNKFGVLIDLGIK